MLAGCGCLLAIGCPGAAPLAPVFKGPLHPNTEPVTLDAGPFGHLHVTGQLSGLAMMRTHALSQSAIPGVNPVFDLSNAQIQVQTTGTVLQFYLQTGLYTLPSLGTAYRRSFDAPGKPYGFLPVAYARLRLTPRLSIRAGALPTLIGAESIFTFQNMNISRGLLWNQETAINHGVQMTYSGDRLSASLSFNDGFYSNKYNWLVGLVSYSINPASTLTFVGGGNLSETGRSTMATPLAQNNSSILNLIYTYRHGALTVSPYLQYTRVAAHRRIGLDRRAETHGAAVLAQYAFDEHFSLAGRGEYIRAHGGSCGTDPGCQPTNLLYGPGSKAWSVTLTPTFQSGAFFTRAELSYTRIAGFRDGLGRNFDEPDQVRGMVETGLLF